MSIGGGIFLMALGAILAFAVQDSWSVMDLTMIGYILIAAGALVTILGLALATRKRKSETVVSHQGSAPVAAAPVAPVAGAPVNGVSRREDIIS